MSQNFKFTIDEQNLPAAKTLIEELRKIEEQARLKLQEIQTLFDASPMKQFVRGFSRQNEARLVRKDGALVVIIHSSYLNREYLEGPREQQPWERLDSRTLNLLLNAKWVTDEQKRALVPLPEIKKEAE